MKHQFSARHKALTEVIKAARDEARLTQRDLSLRLGRSHSFIQRVEIGERSVGFLEAIDIAEALGMDPFDFLDRVLNYGKPGPKIDPIVVSVKGSTKRKARGKAK